ncbi:MAG: FmdE family protein [Methanolinea sp.]|nr:FmdE family protein [Methanolinea sp.]
MNAHPATEKRTFSDCISFHGHSCPGLALGFRAAIAAMEALGVERPEDEELVAICETDACGVDAIQVVAGTTAGKGNLVINDYGKHVFSFLNRKNGRAVRITFPRREEPDCEEFDTLREKVFSGQATPAEEKRFEELKQKNIGRILNAPASDILTIREVNMKSPPKARIFTSVTCDHCGESVADAKTRRVGGTLLCIPCAEERKGQ